MVQNHRQDHDFNQENSSDAPMASGNNKAQQHDHKETVPQNWLKVAAEVALFGALGSWLLVVPFSSAHQSAMWCSGKYMEPLSNLLSSVLKLINQHVRMSKLVPLIEFFSFLVIIWAVSVSLLLGAKFTRIHVAMFLVLSIIMLQGSDTLTMGLYFIIIGLFFIWSSRKTQQLNGRENLQPKGEPKSCF